MSQEQCRSRKLSLLDLSELEQQVKNTIDEISPHKRFNRFNDLLDQTVYKSVYRAYDQDTGKQVRWNTLSTTLLRKTHLESAAKQIQSLAKCQHRSLVNYVDGWISHARRQIVYITESVSGHTLRKHLEKIRRPKMKIIKAWCQQLLAAVEYLHGQGVVHGNIRCGNVLVNTITNQVKLAELGRVIAGEVGGEGAARWRPLENGGGGDGWRGDVYGFGMMLLEMLTVQDPYAECSTDSQLYRCLHQNLKPRLLDDLQNPQLRSIILSCLSQSKPTAKQLLDHPYWKSQDESDNHPVLFQRILQRQMQDPEGIRRGKKNACVQYEEEDINKQFVRHSASVERRDKELETVFLISFQRRKVELRVVRSQYDKEDFQELVSLLMAKLSNPHQQQTTQTTTQQTKSQCQTKKLTKQDRLLQISITQDLFEKCGLAQQLKKQAMRKYNSTSTRPVSPSQVKNFIDILNHEPEHFAFDQAESEKQQAFKTILTNDEVLTFHYDSEMENWRGGGGNTGNMMGAEDSFKVEEVEGREFKEQKEMTTALKLLQIPIFTITETKDESKSKEQSGSSLQRPGLPLQND